MSCRDNPVICFFLWLYINKKTACVYKLKIDAQIIVVGSLNFTWNETPNRCHRRSLHVYISPIVKVTRITSRATDQIA